VKKMWSFFWLMVCTILAVNILAALIAPYLWVIMLCLCLAVAAIVGRKVYVYYASRRSHY